MPKPVDFLTASGEELRDWYYLHPLNTCMSLAELRDQTAAAAEAKVRGECAEAYRRCDERRHELAGQLHDMQRRAERAEAELGELAKSRARYITALAEAEAKNADAKREGEVEGVRKALKAYDEAPTYLAGWQALQDLMKQYAPTPARSVELVVPLDVELKGNAESPFYRVTITPEQARAIVTLAREDGNA